MPLNSDQWVILTKKGRAVVMRHRAYFMVCCRAVSGGEEVVFNKELKTTKFDKAIIEAQTIVRDEWERLPIN